MTRLYMLAFAAALSGSALASAVTLDVPERRCYSVATAHLDTQWNWTIQDTIRDFIPKTLRVNFEWFDKYPDYVFNFEGSFRYRLMDEYYPEQFAKLKKRVAEGRWRVTGSWVDAVDVNLPSTESLIRHALYGNGYYKKTFGKTSVDVFLPDCFGFGYALPSVAAHTGLLGFSTQKLTWGSSVGIPFTVGTWEGVDGSSIVAALDPGGYGSDVPKELNTEESERERCDTIGKQSGAYVDYRYHGTGDTGGGPSERSVMNLETNIKANGPVKVLSAGADQLYRDLTPEQKAKLPHYKGELLMTCHGTGCYTSQAAMKRWNRKNELLADAAERSAVAAEWLGGDAYPRQTLDTAWERFLWHQFHDDLTGTSIPEVYPFSWNDEVLSLNQFASVLSRSVTNVAAGLDTQAKGVPFVVYNPAWRDRQDLAEALVITSSPVRVYGPDGQETPSQVISKANGLEKVLFQAKVPASGYAVYDIRKASQASPAKTGLSVSESSLENSRYKVSIDENGDVASVLDKVQGRELLKSPVHLALFKDYSNNWPAWEIIYDTVSKVTPEIIGGPADVKVVENGPARVSVEVTRKAAGSTFTQRLSLAAGNAPLVFDNYVDWKTKGTLLKAVFNVTASNPNASYDIGLGVAQRGTDKPELYEVPAHQWADITATDGSTGVAVLSESKYGWDKPTDDTIRLTLIHTPLTEDPNHQQATNDLGQHHFQFSLMGHAKDWSNGVRDAAIALNQPLRAFRTDAHPGPLGKSMAFAELSTRQVSLRAIKKAEDSNELVVRLYEDTGKPATGVKLTFPAQVVSVREINGAEDALAKPTAALKSTEKSIVFDMLPFRPRSFAVKLAKPSFQVKTIVAKSIAIPYDLNSTSLRGDKVNQGFDGEGHAIPTELMPKSIVCQGVPFKFGPTSFGSRNAIVCRGQKLSLPAGKWDHVSLLATSVGNGSTWTRNVGSRVERLYIPKSSGWIGQWYSRMGTGKFDPNPDNLTPAFVTYEPIAWVATHRHDSAGKDEPYVYTYLYKIDIAVELGATTLALPDLPAVRVFSATAVKDPLPALEPADVLFD